MVYFKRKMKSFNYRFCDRAKGLGFVVAEYEDHLITELSTSLKRKRDMINMLK